MSWNYYALTLAVILSGVIFCSILISKYRKIKRNGTEIACIVTDCYTPYSTRLAKAWTIEVSYEYDGITYQGKCISRRFTYYAPKVGAEVMLIHIPDKNDILYPTEITRYPMFTFGVLMAGLSLMFAVFLVATMVSLYIL